MARDTLLYCCTCSVAIFKIAVVATLHQQTIIFLRTLLICSYRDNPALGDPNSLIEELLEMRNKIRIKEAELIVVRGKVCTCMCMYTCTCSCACNMYVVF